jgi:glutaredoxin
MTTRVWKIGDSDCPICAEMARYDRTEIYARGAYYRTLNLDDLQHNPQIRDYLKENVVTGDGTIDIPVYVVEWRGILIGWLQGQIERPDFKKKLVEILANRKK